MKTIKNFQGNKCSAGDALIGCLVFILIIAGAVVFVGGYFGLIPGLAKFFGSDRPRDLGIRYANINVEKVHDSIGTKTISVKELPQAELDKLTVLGEKGKEASETAVSMGIYFEGEKPANYTITSEELTALANSGWKNLIFTDVQIKINDDGVVETSAMFRIDRVVSFARSMGFSQEDIDKAMKEYKIPTTNIPVYTKGHFSVTDGVLEIEPQVAEVGRIKLPSSLVSKITSPATEAVDSVIKSFPGFSIKNLSFDKGKMNFEGNVPAKQIIVTGEGSE